MALPTSILRVEPTLFLKSLRIHQVARWTSIFGVNRALFFHDYETPGPRRREYERLIRDHWEYFFTPPYLRKALVPLRPTLRYVGALPPIRLKLFDVGRRPRRGEARIGYSRDGAEFDIGDEAPYRAVNECGKGLSLVEVVDIEARLVKCLNDDYYLGPLLDFRESLREVVEGAGNALVIATDKNGVVPGRGDIAELRNAARVLILFGSPSRDLFELSSGEGFDVMDYADLVWNTAPGQMVASIRTEEALLITLSLINIYLRALSGPVSKRVPDDGNLKKGQ